jgi:hypothetical protein
VVVVVVVVVLVLRDAEMALVNRGFCSECGEGKETGSGKLLVSSCSL